MMKANPLSIPNVQYKTTAHSSKRNDGYYNCKEQKSQITASFRESGVSISHIESCPTNYNWVLVNLQSGMRIPYNVIGQHQLVDAIQIQALLYQLLPVTVNSKFVFFPELLKSRSISLAHCSSSASFVPTFPSLFTIGAIACLPPLITLLYERRKVEGIDVQNWCARLVIGYKAARSTLPPRWLEVSLEILQN